MSVTQITDLTHGNTKFTNVPLIIKNETNTMIADLVDNKSCGYYGELYFHSIVTKYYTTGTLSNDFNIK